MFTRTLLLRIIGGLIALSALSALTACTASQQPMTPTAEPTQSEDHFRSDPFHLKVTLPPGWAAVEGPEQLAYPYTGLVAFNSWNGPRFWAPQVATQDGSIYNPESVLRQMPDDGVYIVLIYVSGGPPLPPEQYGPEYEQQDLSGLWKEADCRKRRAAYFDFFKWGRVLRLEVYCKPNASDETAAAVNALLASWRFDGVPVGDIGWAVVEARQRLPASVKSAWFPIVSEEPSESSVQDGSNVWITQAQVQGETVVVTFKYRWDEPLAGSNSDNCPLERCHWWKFEARSSGEVVLVEEGGATVSSEGSVMDYASLVDRLRAAGLLVEPFGTSPPEFFSVPRQVITVNDAEVVIMEYAEAATAEAEAKFVSPNGGKVTIPDKSKPWVVMTSLIEWDATPHFYQSGRLMVQYAGNDPVVIGALETVLGPQFAGGGAPPPTPTPVSATYAGLLLPTPKAAGPEAVRPVPVWLVGGGNAVLANYGDYCVSVSFEGVLRQNGCRHKVVAPWDQPDLATVSLPAGTPAVIVIGSGGVTEFQAAVSDWHGDLTPLYPQSTPRELKAEGKRNGNLMVYTLEPIGEAGDQLLGVSITYNQGNANYTWRLNPAEVPTLTADQAATATADLAQARAALITYFSLLHAGRYADAINYYGGSYDILSSTNPEIDPNDRVALIKYGCILLMCLEVRTIVQAEIASPTEFKFVVEFKNEDGSLFVRGPCCGASETDMPPESQFAVLVIKVDDRFLVQQLPVYVP